MARARRPPPDAGTRPRQAARSARSANVALSIPRRFLPPLAALSAFEAAARTGSVSEAARELSLTQGAISRQISALEDQLEVKLFVRERQKIRLTPAGHAYVREIREGLQRIGSASMNLRANPAGGSLNIAAPPAFAAKWLIPRLPDFLQQHPAVRVNLLTRELRVSFQAESFDAAIHLGEGDWQEAELLELCGEDVVPVCSPSFQKRHAVQTPLDLRRAPLLHLTSWPDAWEHWFEHYSVPAAQVHGMLFDQTLALAAAAGAGIGVALLSPLLFAEELRRKELLPALPMPLASRSRYRLAWPKDRQGYPPLQAFRGWLAGQLPAGHSETA